MIYYTTVQDYLLNIAIFFIDLNGQKEDKSDILELETDSPIEPPILMISDITRAFISNMSRNSRLCPPKFSISTCPRKVSDKKPFEIPGAFNHQPSAFNHQPTCAQKKMCAQLKRIRK